MRQSEQTKPSWNRSIVAQYVPYCKPAAIQATTPHCCSLSMSYVHTTCRTTHNTKPQLLHACVRYTGMKDRPRKKSLRCTIHTVTPFKNTHSGTLRPAITAISCYQEQTPRALVKRHWQPVAQGQHSISTTVVTSPNLVIDSVRCPCKVTNDATSVLHQSALRRQKQVVPRPGARQHDPRLSFLASGPGCITISTHGRRMPPTALPAQTQ
jgi:hypothetical protein